MNSPANIEPSIGSCRIRVTALRAETRLTAPSGQSPKVEPHDSGEPPLAEYFDSMLAALGPQHWWPGKTPFEVIVGAILVQNTSWANVEGAIAKLRAARLLTPTAMSKVQVNKLEGLIRSSGYFRQKARKLKAFCDFLQMEYGGSLKRMFSTPTNALREQLLGIFGIGPETADSILLYAGNHGVFVADAYAKRLLARHGWVAENAGYEDVRQMVEAQFPGETARFNEFHALIVQTGKQYCRRQQGLCGECPLGSYLQEDR
jgi:endonuclease III related protein